MTAVRDAVWTFLRERTRDAHQSTLLPLSVFIRVYHAWADGLGTGREIEDAIRDAGYDVTIGQRGDLMIRGLNFRRDPSGNWPN